MFRAVGNNIGSFSRLKTVYSNCNSIRYEYNRIHCSSLVCLVRNYRPNGPLLKKLSLETLTTTVSHIPGFTTGNDNKDKQLVLYANSKESAEQDLLNLGFQEPTITKQGQGKNGSSDNDLFLGYLRHINTAFKSSAKNYNKLKIFLQQNDKEITNDQRLSYIFKYLLTESQLEINRLRTLSTDEIARRKLEKSFELVENTPALSSQHLENLVLNDLIYNQDQDQEHPDKDSQISLVNTISLIQLLKDTVNENPKTWNQPQVTGLSIQDIVNAYELFKLVPNETLSKQGVYYSGKLLYNLGTVRLDPVNESFYINSLIANGEYKEAFRLFVSYRCSVKEQWWDRLGLMVLLAGNNMRGFWKLLCELREEEEKSQLPDLPVKVIKLGVKKFIQINDLEKARVLTRVFLELVDKYGVDSSEDIDYDTGLNKRGKVLEFQDEEEANRYLNAVERPTRRDFITIITYYMRVKDLDMLGKLIAKFIEVFSSASSSSLRSYDEVLLKTNLHLLQDFESLKELISKSSRVSPEDLDSFKRRFQEVVKQYKGYNDLRTKNLLFSSINSLINNANVAETVKQIISSEAITIPPPSLTKIQDEEEEEEEINSTGQSPEALAISKSELYKNLLQLLLLSSSSSQPSIKNEQKALDILKCMEECDTDTDTGMQTVYVKPNAHHYAVFIDYYAARIKTGKNKKKKREKSLAKVESILQRMRAIGVEPNAKFLSKLLFFYNKMNDFDSSFKIINSVLNSANNEGTDTSSNRQVTADNYQGNTNATQELSTTTATHGKSNPISTGLYYSIWMTYNHLYSLTSLELSELNRKSNSKLWVPVVKQQLDGLNVHPKYDLPWILNNMINIDNVMPNYTFYRLIIGTLMKAREWELVTPVLILMSDKHGCQVDLPFVKFVLEGIKREFVLHCTREILSRDNSGNSNGTTVSGRPDYATARTMAIEKFRSNKKFLSIFDVSSRILSGGSPGDLTDLLIQQVLRLIKFKDPYDTRFDGVLQQCKYLDVDPGRIINLIDR